MSEMVSVPPGTILRVQPGGSWRPVFAVAMTGPSYALTDIGWQKLMTEQSAKDRKFYPYLDLVSVDIAIGGAELGRFL